MAIDKKSKAEAIDKVKEAELAFEDIINVFTSVENSEDIKAVGGAIC